MIIKLRKWLERCFAIISDERGSSLATVLILIVIITLFIGAIFSGIIIQSRFIQRDINEVKARYAAEAGIASFLDGVSYSSVKSDITLRFIIQDNTEVLIKAKPFGGFLNVKSTANIKGKEKTVQVLAGAGQTEVFEHAVVLGDTTSVFMVTGDTQLKGDILTGQEGIRTTNFKGRPFSGSLEGAQDQGKGKLLPVFDAAFIQSQEERFSSFFDNNAFNAYLSSFSGRGTVPAEEGDTLYFDESISWTSSDSIAFPNDLTIVINGNATFNGIYHFGRFTRLIVRDTLKAGGIITGENMLMYAGKSLQVGGGAELSTQAISGGDIIIRDQAYLKYPSLLYSGKEFSTQRQEIIIDLKNEACLDGTIIYPVQTNNFTSGLFRVRISNQAVVRGGIYTLGQSELEGKVYGSVLTHQFYFYESPSSYINWLKDAEVDLSKRPKNYVIPLGFSKNPQYQILDWLEVK